MASNTLLVSLGAWTVTYLVHSTLLLFSAWLLCWRVAEQFYPRVLDQLKVQNIAPAVVNWVPSVAPLALDFPPNAIRPVGAESIDRDAQSHTRNVIVPKPAGPHKLPSLEELQQLRDDIQGLRRDVKALSELLAKQAHTNQKQSWKTEDSVPGKAKGGLIARVYSVADLVIPILVKIEEGQPNVGDTPKCASEALMELIRTTIEPDTWAETGGASSMRFIESSLSLVIRATVDVHEQLGSLLNQLRKLQDVQVAFEMSIVGTRDELVPAGFSESVAVSAVL